MTDRKSLLTAITDVTDYVTATLVYADWCEERGEELYAAFLRTEVHKNTIHAIWPNNEAPWQLYTGISDPEGIRVVEFHRGIPCSVHCTWDAWEREAENILARARPAPMKRIKKRNRPRRLFYRVGLEDWPTGLNRLPVALAANDALITTYRMKSVEASSPTGVLARFYNCDFRIDAEEPGLPAEFLRRFVVTGNGAAEHAFDMVRTAIHGVNGGLFMGNPPETVQCIDASCTQREDRTWQVTFRFQRRDTGLATIDMNGLRPPHRVQPYPRIDFAHMFRRPGIVEVPIDE